MEFQMFWCFIRILYGSRKGLGCFWRTIYRQQSVYLFEISAASCTCSSGKFLRNVNQTQDGQKYNKHVEIGLHLRILTNTLTFLVLPQVSCGLKQLAVRRCYVGLKIACLFILPRYWLRLSVGFFHHLLTILLKISLKLRGSEYIWH
jgi:hypothetical protein